MFNWGVLLFALVLGVAGMYIATAWMEKSRNKIAHRISKPLFWTGFGVILIGIFMQSWIAPLVPDWVPGNTGGSGFSLAGGDGSATGAVVQQGVQAPPIGVAGISFEGCPNSCPDDGTSDITIDLINKFNSTSEAFDVAVTLFRQNADGSLSKQVELTDTTSPSASSQACGAYVAKIQAGSGDEGDNSWFYDATGPTDAKVQVKDGNLAFCASGASTPIIAKASQHAAYEILCTDKFANGMFNEGDTDASATDYESTAGTLQFHSPTNATNVTVGQGGNYQATCYVRATRPDTVSSERGIVFGLDMASTTWKEPSIKANGVTLTNVKTSMDEFENLEYGSVWEYMYRLDGFQISSNNELTFSINANALSDQNPAAAQFINVTMVEEANYESSKDGATVTSGFVTDASAHDAVQGVFSWTLGVA